MVEETILRTINAHNLISENQHIVIGLSGGPDSVCLFHVLIKLSEKMSLTIHPVHVNHKIRPGDAEHDQKYVEDLCREAELSCRVVTFDCNKMASEQGLTSEEAGRIVRYEAFQNEALEIEAGGVPKDMIRIAVAHNADDQVETILFRLLRGTGTDGLAGMEHFRIDEKGYPLIRPLLDVWKKDILEYCREENLQPCMDYTNEQAVYSRNRIRLKLIPYLQDYNPNIKDTVLRLGKVAAADKEYLAEQAEEALAELTENQTEDEVLMNGEKLRELGKPVRRRVISAAFKRIGLQEDMTFAHFEDADDIIFSDKPSARLDLPHGYYLTKVYEDVKAARDAPGIRPDCRISIISKAEYDSRSLKRGSFAAFDADAVSGRLEWRTRREGDYIAIKGGSKKLQDFFVDHKIPRDERDKIWFAAAGREVLFVPAADGIFKRGRYSVNYAVNDDTKKVILIEIFSGL